MRLGTWSVVMLSIIYGLGNAQAASFDHHESTVSKSAGGNSQCIYVDGYCRCGEEKIKLGKGKAPQGMSLSHASCLWVKDSNYLSSIFKYKGSTRTIGIIKRENNDLFGDHITFEPDSGKYEIRFLSNPTIEDHSRISHSVLVNKLKLPNLSKHNNCWMADLVLEIKEYTVVSDESDYSGTYVDDFEIIKLGKYRACAQSVK